MLELQIADINLKMPVADFENRLSDKISDYNNSYGEGMNYDLKSMSTRMGKSMYKLTIDNNKGSEIVIIGEQDPASGDIMFHPLKLTSVNNSFYKTSYSDYDIIDSDEDPAKCTYYMFKELCYENKGSFACITPDGSVTIIKDGYNKKAASIALIDGDGNVYSCAGAKNVKGASDSASFTVNKPIGDWLQENPDVQREMAKHSSMDAKMNCIGKYLINAKIKEEIDSDEFMDIFCQAGIIGFSEPSVLNIYKLIM